MQAYRIATLEESLERPLIFRFQKYRQKIGELEQRKLELVEQIQQSTSIAKGANIEEIALQSELIETSKELAMLNETLSRIDSIHKKDPSPLALLEVERIAKYQNLPELIAMTGQLRKILGNQDTDSFVRKEVSRNLETTMSKIVREIAGAITQLKSETKEGLKRKEVLEERMIEMRASEDNYAKSSPKYSLLERLNEEIRSQKEIYQSNFAEWKRAKNTFHFEEIEILRQEK